MEITKIERCKKAKGRYNVYLEGEFSFALSEEVLLEKGLRVGDELEEKDIREIKLLDNKRKALESAFRLLSFRPRSEKELQEKLFEKKFDSKIVEEVISRLKELGYLNDREFAKAWVLERKAKKGKIALKQELLRKKISKDLIEGVLEELDPELEFKAAKDLIEKKKIFQKKFKGRELRNKITGFLLRRGFGYEIIKKILGTLEKD